MRKIDELHLEHPFMGARMLRDQLARQGIHAGRRHIRTLRLRMGTQALAVRSALGAEVAPPVRLLAIVGASSLAFVCAATLLDRPSVVRLWSFFRSARRTRTA
jgi:hypothetical protein